MSEPTDATTTSAPTIISTPPRDATGPRRLWLAGRILTTIGAIGFAIFAWTWWWKVEGRGDVNSQYVLLLTPGDIHGVLDPFYFHVLTILGLLLIPSLWLSRRFEGSIISMAAILLWISILVIPLKNQSPLDTVSLIDGLEPQQFTVVGAVQTQFGFLSGFAALILLVIGGMTMLFGLGWLSVRPRESTTARPRLDRLPAAGGLTLGMIFFLIGILGMGWTAVNCDAHPLFLGQCNGLTFTGVLHYGISTNTDAFDPVASLYAIPALLVGGAALVLLGLWLWKRLTPGLSLWLTLYLATATFFYLIAYAGTGEIALHSADLGLESGAWSAQSGLWVAALGLLISWLALIPIWFRALRPAQPTQPTATAPTATTPTTA